MPTRFQINSDEYLNEYRNHGEGVFRHLRPLAFDTILWHKYASKNLEAVIQDVTRRRNAPSEFTTGYGMDEHLRK